MTAGTSPPPITLDGAEKKNVLTVPSRLAAAWSANDAAAVADVFTSDGVLIWPGVLRKGRTEIQEFLTALFAGPLRGSGMTGTTVDVRFITDDVALLRTHDVIRPAGSVPEYLARTTWTCVRSGDQWHLAGYQHTVRGGGAALPDS